MTNLLNNASIQLFALFFGMQLSAPVFAHHLSEECEATYLAIAAGLVELQSDRGRLSALEDSFRVLNSKKQESQLSAAETDRWEMLRNNIFRLRNTISTTRSVLSQSSEQVIVDCESEDGGDI